MKNMKTALIVIVISICMACSSSKKSTTTVASSTPAPAATTTAPSPKVTASSKPKKGTFAPGDEQLNVLKFQFPEVTLEKLQEGYSIYTQGACRNCHEAKDIYLYDEVQWIGIMDNMAKEARLSEPEKDAVHKYVLSIKRTQVK